MSERHEDAGRPTPSPWRRRAEAMAVIAVCAAVLLAQPVGAIMRHAELTLVEIEDSTSPAGGATIGIQLDAPLPVLGVQLDLAYDSSVCRVTGISEGSYFAFKKTEPLGLTFFHPGIPDDESGTVTKLASCRLQGETLAVKGTNNVATFVVEPVQPGTTCGPEDVTITSVMVVNDDGLVVVATGAYADKYMYLVPLGKTI